MPLPLKTLAEHLQTGTFYVDTPGVFTQRFSRQFAKTGLKLADLYLADSKLEKIEESNKYTQLVPLDEKRTPEEREAAIRQMDRDIERAIKKGFTLEVTNRQHGPPKSPRWDR